MSDNELNSKFIENTFNQYHIKLSYHLDIVNIQIKDNYNIYESNFNLEILHQYKLLISSLTIDEMIEFINELINKKNIKIKKKKKKIIIYIPKISTNKKQIKEWT